MIIKSLLSCDMYKLTMLQIFFMELPGATAKYKFKCRNEGVDLLQFRKEIEEEIDHLCTLKHTTEELDWLATHRFFFDPFINYLEDYTLKRRHITVGENNGQLEIIMEGPLTGVSPFEIFVLKIVQEVYMRNVHPLDTFRQGFGRSNLLNKINDYNEFVDKEGFKPDVIDFGGRRNFSTEWHEFVVKNLTEHGVIVGTSDMDLARRLGIKAIGTMAHEFVTMFQAFTHPMNSQKIAFETWLDFYGNDLNILLSDTLGDKLFLLDMTPDIAHRSSGVRHDSGDPFVWGKMMLTHYKAFGIDPMTKTLVFSDGLDFPKMFELAKYFNGKIKVSFGVGTNLTNDLGVDALQNVCKQIEVNGFPVCKLSNNISKAMCEDLDYMNYLKSCLDKI
ncbi:MAG: nicotinate phosphoribosyltransferase [Petrotogales bacterium]